MTNELKDIRKMDLNEVMQFMLDIGEPKFRAKQIYEWLWKKHATSFDEMTNLSISLRDKLTNTCFIRKITLDTVQHSNDGTIKSRYLLHDGRYVESVLIPRPKSNKYTVCVSSQVGCSLACSFCATGTMETVRNLDVAEIYDQVVHVKEQCEEKYGHNITNIVYMGMGEPLLNFSNMIKSIDFLTGEYGMGMSPRRITVSTAGITKSIKKLGDMKVRFNLALSLHAADDEKRNKIMPINVTNSLDNLMGAIKYFYEETGSKISFEYIAFKDINDSIEDAKNLVELTKQFPVKVNIIEYNTVEGLDFVKTDEDKLNKFAQYVRNHHVMITVRRSRGKDIDAACGQLANKDK